MWPSPQPSAERAGPLRPGGSVAVVGASAAGLYAAWLLACGGARVEVFEQAPQLEPAPRTLIVTQKMCDLLGPLAQPSLIRPIHFFEIYTNGCSARIPLRQPDWVIERSCLIATLAEYAQQAGARLHCGQRFLRLGVASGKTQLEFRSSGNGCCATTTAAAVIGADGTASRVAQAAGWPRPQTACLLQAVVRLPARYPEDTVRLWFIPEETPYFFWLIPSAQDRGVVGLIAEQGAEARHGLERFLERQQLDPLEYQGARVPLYSGWRSIHRRLGTTDVYLVGDAAAQVKVTTVGGVVTGFRGARAVAEAILHGDGRNELRALRLELEVHRWLRRLLHRFTEQDYARLLALLDHRTLYWLSYYHRDQAGRLLHRLCRSQPRLLWLALRAVLAGGRPLARNPRGRTNRA